MRYKTWHRSGGSSSHGWQQTPNPPIKIFRGNSQLSGADDQIVPTILRFLATFLPQPSGFMIFARAQSQAPHQMIRPRAWRCISRLGRATRPAWAQHHTAVLWSTRASSAEHHPRRQHARQSYSTSTQNQAKLNDTSHQLARQGNDLSETEDEWILERRRLPDIAEQEARFERSPNGVIITRVLRPCSVCGSHFHNLGLCPLVFEDNPFQLYTPPRAKSEFDKRMRTSHEFYDAVEWMRRRFAHRLPGSPRHVPLLRSETQDAPPLARGKEACLPDPSVSWRQC